MILLFLSGLWMGSQAQFSRAKATLEHDTVMIGDQQWLSLELTVPKGSKVTAWPAFQDTLTSRVEVLRNTAIDTVASGENSYTLKQELLITVFDSGEYTIRPIPFRFLIQQDTTTYYTETMPLDLIVKSPEIDPAGDIKPIKPPLAAPVTFAEMAPWLAGALGVILLTLAIIYYLRRKKANKPVFQIRQKPKLPPHQVALDALEKLKKKKLWQAGRVKEYYTELTDIIRVYIEDRYHIMAMEMTTEEINATLKGIDISKESSAKLYSTLLSADMVKFAKSKPLPDDNDTNYRHCVDFVRETKPVTDLRQNVEVEEMTDKPDNQSNS
jgi:hypothetical protein